LLLLVVCFGSCNVAGSRLLAGSLLLLLLLLVMLVVMLVLGSLVRLRMLVSPLLLLLLLLLRLACSIAVSRPAPATALLELLPAAVLLSTAGGRCMGSATCKLLAMLTLLLLVTALHTMLPQRRCCCKQLTACSCKPAASPALPLAVLASSS
jgi:hypothetical protein